MIRSVTVLALLLFVGPIQGVYSQTANDDQTHGLTNGRGYLKLNRQARIALLAGIDDGMVLMAYEHHISAETINNYRVTGFLVSDFVEIVNAIYNDKSNIRIPVAYAYLYAIKKVKGDSSDNLDTFLVSLRRKFAE